MTVSAVRTGRRGIYIRFKRVVDFTASLAILLVASPLLLLCAALTKLGSKGPVFFGHKRCGRGNRPFHCLKFRTMVVDAEDWLEKDDRLREHHQKNGFKLPHRHDPRVTPVGRVLRRTHLDELPQFLNVLRGDMSLVGPRPIVERELELYGERAGELLSVRPGIFGAWTAQGRARVGYPERVEVELAYVRTVSARSDLAILLRHVPVLLGGQQEA